MATAPFPFFPYAYASTAAYPPTASGFSTAPVYPFPSIFPCAATYPYPPSAVAYTPPSGFSPNWPVWPPPPPFASTFPSPIPSQIDPYLPPPAPTPIHGDLHHTVAEPLVLPYPPVLAPPPESSAPPATDSPSPPAHRHHFPLAIDLSSPTARLLDPIPTAPGRQSCKSQRDHSSTASVPTSSPQDDLSYSKTALTPSKMTSGCASAGRTVMEYTHEVPRTAQNKGPSFTGLVDDPAVLAATDERAQAKDATRHRQHHEFLNLQARLDKQMARDRTSLEKLSGELSKLSASVSQFAVTMGMQTTESPATSSSPPVASVQFRSAATIAPSFSNTGAAARSPASSLSSPSDAAAPAYVARQVFDEISQCYGLHSLDRCSLFRADGTEHGYFALPADYPLPQATPPMSPSLVENFGGTDPTFVAAQAAANISSGSESLIIDAMQPPMTVKDVPNVSKKMQVYDVCAEDATVRRSCLNPTVDISAPPNELVVVCVDKASDNWKVQQVNNQQWNMLLTEMGREIWDPGASASLHSSKLRVSRWSVLVSHERRKEWDPGDTELHVLFQTAAGATKLQGIDVYKSEITSSYEIQKLLNSLLNVKEMIPWIFWKLQLSNPYVMGYLWGVLYFWDGLPDIVWASTLSNTSSVWDPGILNQMDMMLDKSAVPNLVPSGLTPFKLLIFIEPSVDLKQLWAWLLLQCHSWRTTYSNCFPQAQEERDAAAVYHDFKIQLPRSRTSHIFDPGVQLSLHCSLDILTEWRETVKLLSCTNIPELAMWQGQVMMLVFSASCRESSENRLADQELMANTSTTVAALTWHNSLPGTPFILLSSTTYTWDPGVLTILAMMLDKYTMSQEVKFIQWTTESFSSTDCIQYIAPNSIYSVLHATSFLMQRAAHLSQGNYIFSLHYKSMLKTEYCQMRCLWKFSIKLAKRFQWEPRVFTHVLQPIFASAITCSYAFALEWAEVKLAAVIVLVVPCSEVQVTKQRLPLDFWVMDEKLQNVSEFRDGQLTCMVQSPAPNFFELLRAMVTALSCWLPSFENKAKLQWDPGIELVHQQGVYENYNAKNLLSSPNYLQIWKMDIILITFLPP